MGWKWSEFSSSDQQKMEVEISEYLANCNGELVTISAYLNGFLALDSLLSSCQRMKDSLFAGLSRRKADSCDYRQVANIIYSLGKLGILWNEFPRETQRWFYQGVESCSASFIPQHISSLFYGYESRSSSVYFI
jgi:hypothetical protein